MDTKTQKIYDAVLEACVNGHFHQDLKILYQMPYRNKVDWSRFPLWAVPNLEIEGCHEG